MFPSGFEAPRVLKNIVIYTLFAFLFILSLAKIPLISAQTGQQGFVLVALYFWQVFRPSLFPYILVFAVGLLYDLTAGGMVGLNTLCFLVMAIVVRGQRRFLLGQSWQVVWAGYCVAVIGVVGFQGLVFALQSWTIPELWAVGINIGVSCLLYPLFLPVLMLINRQLSH